jgi:hypothetical protein
MSKKDLTMLVSGAIDSFIFLHEYRKNKFDDILIILENNTLMYLQTDSDNEKVICRKSILYKDTCVELLKAKDKSVTKQSILLKNCFGVTFSEQEKTIFVVYEHKRTQKTYLLQISTNDLFESSSIFVITTFFGLLDYRIMDLFIRENFIYTDTKTSSTKDVFITYLDKSENSIRGVWVFCTEEEKQSFREEFPNVDFPDNEFPVVDIWSGEYPMFTKLSQDSKDVKLNFSKGLAFIKFDGE